MGKLSADDNLCARPCPVCADAASHDAGNSNTASVIAVNLHDPDLKWSREPFTGHDMLASSGGATCFAHWHEQDDDDDMEPASGYWRVVDPFFRNSRDLGEGEWPQGFVFLRWQHANEEMPSS